MTTKTRERFFRFDTRRYWPVLAGILAAGAPAAPQALAAGPPTENLADLSLEELSNIQVTSVSRQHPEIGAPATRRETGGGVYGKMSWRF